MNHDREALEHEQALVALFRAHADGQPSTEVDAQILAAASAAAREAKVVVAPNWNQRLNRWLFGSARQRWSVALAGLACVGIGLSLTWRTLEQAPAAFDAMPPAAPMAAGKRSATGEGLARQAAAPAAERRQEAAAPPLQSPPAAAMADAAVAEPAALAELVAKAEPRDSLLRLLELRRAGEQEEAARLLAQLHADHPQLDIDAELGRLAAEAER